MKADVYSFGVLTLEVVSGKSSSYTDYGGGDKLLVEWVRDFFYIIITRLKKILKSISEIPFCLIVGLGALRRRETGGFG